MIKKIIIGAVVLASLPALYITGPLFLPYRTVVQVYYTSPFREQVLARLDAEKTKMADLRH